MRTVVTDCNGRVNTNEREDTGRFKARCGRLLLKIAISGLKRGKLPAWKGANRFEAMVS